MDMMAVIPCSAACRPIAKIIQRDDLLTLGPKYDPNGNLLTLNRKDNNAALSSDFTYNYYSETNKLQNLNGEADYRYDEIGNLTADPSQNVSSIEWTPYGKVRQVTKSDGATVSFKYDGAGNRIEKSATKDGVTVTTPLGVDCIYTFV